MSPVLYFYKLSLVEKNFPLKTLLWTHHEVIHHHHHAFSSCRNHMESLPDWLVEAKKLEVLDVSHNLITELPAK